MKLGNTLARGLYVVTGGLGGLGLRAATLLVEGGASVVVLASRSGHSRRDEQDLEMKLASLRAAALVMASDVTDALDVSCLFAPSSLVGVLHAAGLLRDKTLSSMAASDLDAVFASKSLAASHLHAAIARTPIEALGLFSSVVSTFGNIGQANYVAASAYLDGIARYRRMCGSTGSSLQIPAVSGAGMSAATFTEEQLDAVGAISLNEFAVWLSYCLTPGRTAVECTQTLLASQLLEKIRSLRALAETQPRGGPISTCEEEVVIVEQESHLPRSTGEHVRLSIAENVALLELNDPSHFNALTMEMASDMQIAVQWLKAQGHGSIISVVLQGAGDHFCPGGNLYRNRAPTATSTAGARAAIDLFDGFCRLRTLPMPTLCAVHGTVLGGGLAVCLLTDYVACNHAASFQVGERSREIYPAGLLRRTLSDAIGPSAALSLYLTDSHLTSMQAHGVGLMQAVTPSVSNAQQHVQSLAHRYASSIGTEHSTLQAGLSALSNELPSSERHLLAVDAFAQVRISRP
jgi:enoyl-CoA hydratase/carnithine racemase/NADP-dependent 3-hydroxy acid dehydrogenase YdfG